MTDEDDTQTAEAETTEEQPNKKDPVKKATFILLGVALFLLILYLVGDRVTPYTTQARVNALVVPVAAEVSGTVTEVAVSSNSAVNAGDLLFQVDRERYELALEQAAAGLETARKGMRASTADVDAAKAQLISARANYTKAEQDAVRLRRIKAEDAGAISDRRIEIAEATLAAATGGVQAAEATLRKAEEALGDVGDQNAQVQQALSAYEQAQLNFERTSVVAPADGIVTEVRVDRGNFAGAGAPLMTFVATHDIWIQADFTENNLGRIKRGDEVEIVFDALPGEVVKGTVRTTGFGVNVDSSSLGTLQTIDNDRQWLRDAQRFSVLVDFELPEAEDRAGIRVGAQASIMVYTGNNWFMNAIGWVRMRVASVLTYAY